MFRNKNIQETDRFIPCRANQDFELANYLLSASSEKTEMSGSEWDSRNESKYINYAHKIFKRQAYRETLWSTLLWKDSQKFIPPMDSFDHLGCSKNTDSQYKWPVHPRKKPTIAAPLTILDMPDLSSVPYHHIADWGKTGYLASIYRDKVYAWHHEADSPYLLATPEEAMGRCIRWNHSGYKIAIALYQEVGIYDCIASKMVYKGRCICKKCFVTCIDWSIDDNSLVTGCINGRMCVWSSTLQLNIHCQAHDSCILRVLFSPGNNYIVSSGRNGRVRMWRWPLVEQCETILTTRAKALAWHPWQHNLLAMGEKNGCINLYKVNTMEFCGCFAVTNYTCDALTWNEITGEMVISCFNANAKNLLNKLGRNIVIVSDSKYTTDAIEWHTNRVPYLMWSPDSTQLATAGVDESLCIWPFIKKSKKSENGSSVLDPRFR